MKCEMMREKLHDLVFDLLDEAERREVEAHVAACPACREALKQAWRERELLKKWAVAAPPRGLADRAIARARSVEREGKAMTVKRVEPEVRWLGSRMFWRIAALIVIAALTGLAIDAWRVLGRHASPAQAFLYGQAQLTPGLRSGFRVFVRDAWRQAPIAGAKVRVWLVSASGSRLPLGAAATDANGLMLAEALIPSDLPEGAYKIEVQAAAAEGESAVSRSVEVKRSFRTMISTDKPVYQPGQVIRIRTLTLATADLRPVSDRDVVIEVMDSKGNKVFKKRARPSEFGIASADFELADQVNTGDYAISAAIGDTVSERSVNVSRYVLPKFKIEVTPDRAYYMPGEKVSADLFAEYTFGKPVAGAEVSVTAQEFIEKFRDFATAAGVTDAEGRYHFEIPLKTFFVGQDLKKGDAIVKLGATVTDKAGHAQTKTVDLTVTDRPIRIEVFPESGELVLNVENILYIVTAYPDGRPAKTKLSVGGDRQSAETSEMGIAKVKITPARSDMQLTVEAQDARGVRAQVVRALRVGERNDGFLLRADHAVYRTGETANLEVISAVKTARVFLDVVKDRRTVLMKGIDVEGGRGKLAFDLPHDLAGTLELHAYRIMSDGNIVRDTKLIQVARAEELKVTAELDKPTYRPGEQALLKFLVQQADGAPAQAALSLAGVDEAVFALSDMRPGLEEVYFMLQEEILKPRYEIHAHAPVSPVEVIQPTPQPDLEEAKVVLFSAASGGDGPKSNWDKGFEEKQRELRHHKDEYLRTLGEAAVLAPFGLFLLFTLPIFGYAVVRLFWREPVWAVSPPRVPEQKARKAEKQPQRKRGWLLLTSLVLCPLATATGIVGIYIGDKGFMLAIDIALLSGAIAFLLVGIARFCFWLAARRAARRKNQGELPEFGRAMKSLARRWVLAVYAPLLAAFGVALAAQEIHIRHAHRISGVLAMVAALAAALVLTILLFLAARRVRSSAAAEVLPFLRKAVGCVPWAYLFAVVGAVPLAFGVGERLVPHDFIALVALAGLGGGILVVGALSIARHAALRRISVARWFWLAVSRPVGVAIPLMLVLFLPALSASREFGLRTACLNNLTQFGFGLARAREEARRASPWELRQIVRADASLHPEAGEFLMAKGGPGPRPESTTPELKLPTRIRRYFPETLFWRPELITDAAGRAQLQVPLADSITTWRVAMSAVSRTGQLGAATHPLRVFQDFFVDIDFPVALTQNDEVSVPVAVFNYLDKPQTVRLEVSPEAWCELLDSPTQELAIPAKEVKGASFRLRALRPGRHSLALKAFGSEMSDAVEREVTVTPDGRAVVQTINETLRDSLTRQIVIPDDAIDGASDLLVKIYPGAFSQVVEGMDSIFQMPSGCFEQTSSTTYPNVLVLDYMRRTKQTKPDVEMKALNYINLGCQRLLSYEVKGGGFEWFGHAPAHVALTAYGLMEFSDMAKVHEVDPAVIKRTREWLLSQQKGSGVWEPTAGGIAEGAINAFQGATLRTTAYVAWALAEAGLPAVASAEAGEAGSRLDRTMEYLDSQAREEKDPYTLALCANALIAAGRASGAREIVARLGQAKIADKETVHWISGGEGATFSRGNALDIETTALAAYAMLRSRDQMETAHKALAWLIQQKDPRGTWYSTQATVHAMRALLAGSGPGGEADVSLDVAISVNGESAPRVKITPDTSDVFRLISLRQFVRRGRNVVALEPSGKGSLACQIVATHYMPWPKAEKAPTLRTLSPQGERETAEPLEIAVQYDAESVKQDATLGCRVTLRYNRPGAAQMTIVDLGIPPGFEVLTDAFDRMKEKGVIERYTLTGRQIILYFREIPSGAPIEFSYLLKAKFPVRAKTPLSRAYQYYEPEVRAEAAPVVLTVL